MMFVRGYTRQGYREQAFHVHVRYTGDWDEYIFRDFLMSHQPSAAEYGRLKHRLAVKFRNDRDGYTEAKTHFIQGIVTLARGGFRNILFDLDGTLTDPREGIVKSILHAVGELGIFENNPLELDAFIGPPLAESFRERYGLSEEMTDRAIRVYREYFSTRGKFENRIYPGIREMLDTLAGNGCKLFIATSKPTIFANQIAEYFDMATLFTDVVGCNLDNTRSDKTEVISHIIEHHRLEPARTLMVGDRKHDLIGAANCGIASLAVAYGYGTLAELEGLGALGVAADVKELGALLLVE
jgi:phosphoglycolate phosphatase